MELISKDKVIMGRPQGKKDMVFCIFYCSDAKPYKNSDKYVNDKKMQNLTVPLVLMQSRVQDGQIGFVGGNVEESDKSLEDALIRECWEEISLQLVPEVLKPFATFADDTRHISSYLCEVSYESINMIQRTSYESKHFGVENGGTILFHLHKKSIENILKHNFSGTSKEELILLIEKLEKELNIKLI